MCPQPSPEISLALPAYNEQENIREVVSASRKALEAIARTWEILVIDNCSSDDTAAVVTQMAQEDPRVRLLRHETNRLYSGSCRTALSEARGRYVAIMDSDGQFTANDLPACLERLEAGANLVFGWRKVRHDTMARKVMSWVFNLLARWRLGCRLHDLNVGIRMMDRRTVDVAEIKHRINMVNPELYVRAVRAGLVIEEIQATHFGRTEGVSCHDPRRLVQIFLQVNRYFGSLQHEATAISPSNIHDDVEPVAGGRRAA